MGKLTGRVAVVTGAATGIGKATSLELARRGCDVALVTRANKAGLDEVAEAIRALGRKASVHMADVGDREAMSKLPAEVEAEHGRVHILVNNAGVTLMGDFEEVSLENMDWIVNINLWGVLHGTKFFLPLLQREDWGHVCNVSSMQGIMALTSQTTYSATKFAVRGFSEALRGELAPQNIGVSVVFPGLIKTEVASSARAEGDAAMKLQKNLKKFMGRFAAEVEPCAKQIVDGIEKNRARTLITGPTRMVDLFKRVMPTLTDALVAPLSRKGIPDF
jgi:short-subunit dehydrogenase